MYTGELYLHVALSFESMLDSEFIVTVCFLCSIQFEFRCECICIFVQCEAFCFLLYEVIFPPSTVPELGSYSVDFA